MRRSLDLVRFLAFSVAPCALYPAAAADPSPGAGRHGIELEECGLEGVERPALCGELEVPENRGAEGGRRIALAVALLPAADRGAAAAPVFFLSGGPGSSSIDAAKAIAESLGGPVPPYDLVFVDQRGTGRSNPLRCPYQDEPGAIGRLLAELHPPAGVASCLEALRSRARPELYTTAAAAADLEAVRRALGYRRVSLVGSSYGTRVALVYLRDFPGSAARVVLRGPVPTDLAAPSTFARDLERALAGLVEDCAADAACSRRHPRLAEEIESVSARLGASPVELSFDLPESGSGEVTMRITEAVFAQAVRYMLYLPEAAARLPWIVHRAALGDYRPLARFAAERAEAINGLADGLYLSVNCTEDAPFFSPAEARRAAAGTLLGSFRVDRLLAACERWPRGSLPAGFRRPVVSDVPTLVVVGELDPATPPRLGRQVAEHLGRHRLVVVPEGGHGFAEMAGESCILELQREFLAGAELDDLDLACVGGMKRPPFFLGEDESGAGGAAAAGR